MTVGVDKKRARRALELINAAFADRVPPSIMTVSKQLSDIEYDEVMSFEGRRWQDTTFAQVAQNQDAVYWFSPEAFCYFLPGILAAGLRENRWDTNAYDAVVGQLDRSPDPDSWDDFFLPRWTLLTAPEIHAVGAWVSWLEAVQPDAYHNNTYERARETLLLLEIRSEVEGE